MQPLMEEVPPEQKETPVVVVPDIPKEEWSVPEKDCCCCECCECMDCKSLWRASKGRIFCCCIPLKVGIYFVEFLQFFITLYLFFDAIFMLFN